MKTNHILYVAAVVLVFQSCATNKKSSSQVNIIERSDNNDSRPAWVSIENSIIEKDGKTFFIAYTEVPGRSLKSAALNISDEKALSEPMRSLVQEFLDQNQLAEDLNSTTGQRILSAARGYRVPMPSLKISKRYWEIVEYISFDNSSEIRLRVYSMAEINTSELKKAENDFLDRINGNSEIKQILKDVGEKQRKNILTRN